jgi:hypothetical protein
MNNASRKSGKKEPNHALLGAVLGALATFVALTGAVAIAETPRRLSTITESLVSIQTSEILPWPWQDAPRIPTRAQASASRIAEQPRSQDHDNFNG